MSLYKNISALEQLRGMYPRWYLDIYEMAEIIKIEALISENLQKAIDYILDNHFIDTIDGEKALELEEYLNITGISDRPIEEQRGIIKTYFIGRGNLSMSQLIAIIEALSGGKCSGTFLPGDVSNNHYISMKITDCDIKSNLLDIISTLKARVPAHLAMIISYKPATAKMTFFYNICQQQNISSVVANFSGEYRADVRITTKCAVVSKTTIIYSTVITTEIPIVFGGKVTKDNEDSVFSGGNLSDSTYDKIISG